MNIRVHIDRLILDGVALSPAEQPHFQAAVQAELGRLLMEQGMANGLSADTVVDSVRGGGVQLHPGSSGQSLGRQVAHAVYGGLGK